MSQPAPYTRSFSFNDFQAGHPSTPLPGDKVNAEFDQVDETIGQIIDRIARLQDDDLALKRKSVGYDQLSDEIELGFEPPTTWTTETAYVVRATVFTGNKFYRCLVSHTSGVFADDLAAGDWELVADFTAATTAAQVAQVAAEVAQAAAESAETNAESAEAQAITSAGNAATSADQAAASALSSDADATSASASAASALASNTAAGLSAVSAAASAASASSDADGVAAILGSLTALSEVTPGSAGLAILADATVGDVRDYIILPVMPEAMASWDDGATAAATADAIEEACAVAVADNRPVLLSNGKTYTIDQLTIPANTVFAGTGKIRSDGTLTGSEVTITFGDNVQFESLIVSTPGDEANGTLVQAGDNFQGTYLEIVGDTNRPGRGIQTTGRRTRIAHFKSEKIDRPMQWFDQAAVDAETPCEGSWIGYFEVDGHVRAFNPIYCDRWSVGTYRIGKKSPNAAIAPGNNAILINGCWHWHVGDGLIEESGEHPARLSGGGLAKTDTTPVPRGCQHWSFGHTRVEHGVGGVPIKINSFSNARSGHGYIASITGVDIGTGFGNQELVRASHCDWIGIGAINCEFKNSRLSYDAKTGDFAVGETVAGAGGASAEIVAIKDISVDGLEGTLVLGPITGGPFVNNEALTGSIAGGATAKGVNCDFSGTYAVQANDVTHIYIGEITGAPRALFNFDATSDADGVDYLKGPISHFHVGRVPALVAGGSNNAIAFVMDGENISDVYIDGMDTSGFATSLAFCQATGGGTVFTGPVRLTGRATGAVRPYITNIASASGSNFVEVDIEYDGRRFVGRPANLDIDSNAVQQWAVRSAFGAGNQEATGLLINSTALTPGSGNYLGGIEGTRAGSGRRGWAIVGKQFAGDAQNTGVAICTGGTTAGTDALTERFAIDHFGRITAALPTFADNAAAVTGGLVATQWYKTATGELRIVV